MIRIHVVDGSGRPVSGADVHISWPGGWTYSNGRTDSSGTITFDLSSPREGTVSINGKEIAKYVRLSDNTFRI